ncbi:HAD family hydrolase [Rhodothermus profundi]|uniref:phosphoglycolate phosphatase n=1 Tax=Rhodothermus profundi TaxID=633813 RepID=A0A1M6QCS5_9BACT|nr:HAD-IA family hydrolase [Rhodothermus profundi]SHK17976.1 phosphoglycolate phosphatase [Rhodothermus profundi]
MRVLIEVPLLICDFDGTVARLHLDWRALKQRLARAAQGWGMVWDEGAGIDKNLRRLRIEKGGDAFKELCRLIAEEEAAAFDPASVHPVLYEVLRKRRSRPVGIVSSNTHAALSQIFNHSIWREITPYIVGKEDVWSGKPSPEGLLKVCHFFNIDPRNAIYVGDTELDQLAAFQAGITFVNIEQCI